MNRPPSESDHEPAKKAPKLEDKTGTYILAYRIQQMMMNLINKIRSFF